VTATGDSQLITTTAQVQLLVVNATLLLTKTVGIAAITPECTTQNARTVPISTTVIYCYTVTNTGDEALTNHSLLDDPLGFIPVNSDLVLQLNASMTVVVTHTLTISVTNVATWTAALSQVTTTAALNLVCSVTLAIIGPTGHHEHQRSGLLR
jgi:hypothetical protein